jgi:hypothetical protein
MWYDAFKSILIIYTIIISFSIAHHYFSWNISFICDINENGFKSGNQWVLFQYLYQRGQHIISANSLQAWVTLSVGTISLKIMLLNWITKKKETCYARSASSKLELMIPRASKTCNSFIVNFLQHKHN